MTKTGLKAIEHYSLPAFIDSSCRREPDFENPYPSITALCRQGQFAPHLKVNDIVAYITVGGKINPYKKGHHLVAILQVVDVYETHQIGEIEYRKNKIPTPSNCMITGNYPLQFSKTGGNFNNKTQEKMFLARSEVEKEKIGERRIKNWNNEYLAKSIIWKCFVKTKPLFLEINKPPLISKSDFNYIFGKTPNTRNPNLITKKQLSEIAQIGNLELIIE